MASEKEKSSATAHQAPSHIAVVAPAAPVAPVANGADRLEDMNTVREILFGETKRSTEKAIAALDAKVEDLTSMMLARFSEVMALIGEVQKNAENSQATAIDEIGAAISQLSSTIRNVSVARKPK